MDIDLVKKFQRLLNSLDESRLFSLHYRDVFFTKYNLVDTPLFVEISMRQEEEMIIQWEFDLLFQDRSHIQHYLSGEEAFDSIPDKYKEDIIFYMDLFSLAEH